MPSISKAAAYKELVAAIVKANPLDKRHPKCKEHHLMGFKDQPDNQVCIFCGYSPSDYPCALAAVLLAILEKNPANRTRVCLESSGQFFDKLSNQLGVYWDLRHDSLSQQSDECKAFLHSLLCDA